MLYSVKSCYWRLLDVTGGSKTNVLIDLDWPRSSITTAPQLVQMLRQHYPIVAPGASSGLSTVGPSTPLSLSHH